MSILASKLIAINIVDMQSPQDVNQHVVSLQQTSLENDRLAMLEARINELTAWKRSMTPVPSSDESSSSAPDSPRSMSSIMSGDVPPLSALSQDAPLSNNSNNNNIKSAEPSKKAKKQAAAAAAKPDTDMASRILTTIQGYGQNENNAEGNVWLGRDKFIARVRKNVDENQPIDLVLPAFPWKSVNKVEKVLGALPDLGEEMGLGRLQNLCEDIQAIYPPGAFVTITSDGLVYNDLVGIPDEEVYEYGAGLRRMAAKKGYDRLKFIRIMNLLGLSDSPYMSKEDYLKSIASARKTLIEKYLPQGFDVRDAILSDPDINLTYCGYIIFLTKDLKHSPVAANVTSNRDYRRVVKRVAHDMITRGKAFAALIESQVPHYVRLSIHRSTGVNKLSFPLVPDPCRFSMTPWHCCLAVTAKGQFRTSHAAELKENFDLVEQGGRPYFYRDRSEVWKWDVPVEFEFFYPKGVYVRAKVAEGEAAPKLGPAELAKMKELGKGFSPIIPLGFA